MTKKTAKKTNKNEAFEPNKMALAVATTAVVTLVLLAFIATMS
ncbi:MAG TPA: hypothetical protein VFS14_01925 [Candidatus Saccharimonadales bacterium]|nr:hypothetical protein [Candidatus Saccharimonadales bacterium]